jgi:hypothetical protein
VDQVDRPVAHSLVGDVYIAVASEANSMVHRREASASMKSQTQQGTSSARAGYGAQASPPSRPTRASPP